MAPLNLVQTPSTRTCPFILCILSQSLWGLIVVGRIYRELLYIGVVFISDSGLVTDDRTLLREISSQWCILLSDILLLDTEKSTCTSIPGCIGSWLVVETIRRSRNTKMNTVG